MTGWTGTRGTGPFIPDPPPGGLSPPESSARAEVLESIHESPELHGAGVGRWTLALIGRLCPHMDGVGSVSGVWRRLNRARIRWKCGRLRVTSPDPLYREKVAAVSAARQLGSACPENTTVLFADEFTMYRQPLPGRCYHERGGGATNQPRATLAHASNTHHRIIGALDAVTGRVVHAGASKIRLATAGKFLRLVRRAYGEDRRIILIWDNWPVHHHEKVLEAAIAAKVELLFLPTYAPWTNPIEKLWKQLKDDVLRMHVYSEHWPELKQRTQGFLDQFSDQSPELLRYTGLALND